MALIAACVIEPGSYFAMNSPPALIGTSAAEAAAKISGWGFVISTDA
jgi:carbon starvation protein